MVRATAPAEAWNHFSSENLARKAFQELDKDKSGFITAEELKSGLMEKLEQKVDQMIKEADVDGDHKISFLEFAKVNNVESARSDEICPDQSRS